MVGEVKVCDNLVRLLGDLELITELFKVCALLVFWTRVELHGGDG